MAANPTVNRAELFNRYESALGGLARVPTRLAEELSKAEATSEAALSKAAAAVKDDERRLTRLRQSITARFTASAQSLREADVLIPDHVRAASGQRGDANSLAAAVNAQGEAEKTVARELQAAINAAKIQATGERSRVVAGREAGEALRKRQEEMRKARQAAEAEAERKRLAEKQRLRQQRRLMIVGSAVALIVLIVLATLLL